MENPSDEHAEVVEQLRTLAVMARNIRQVASDGGDVLEFGPELTDISQRGCEMLKPLLNRTTDPFTIFDGESAKGQALPSKLAVAAALTEKCGDDGLLPNGQAGRRKLKPCEEIAYSQYRNACQEQPELKTDRDAYEWLAHRVDTADELTAFSNWGCYLSRARSFYGVLKHKPRTQRAHGSSIVQSDQV